MEKIILQKSSESRERKSESAAFPPQIHLLKKRNFSEKSR